MSDSLRIGIACYPTYGGSGVLATELGLALQGQGHEVHLFSYARPTRLGRWHRGITFHGVSVSSYPLFRYPPYDLALTTLLRQVMAERDLQILHVHYAVPHALCAYLAREMIPDCRTRIVTTLHGTDTTILGRDPAYGDVIRFGLDKSDAVVCVSKWLEDQTREVFAFDKPIHVLSNFVDERRFTPRDDTRVRTELGAPDELLITHVSNFRSLKRAPDAVEVMARLPRDLPCRLLMVGEGPDQCVAREAAARHGLCDRVEFLGPVDDVESILSASDVALFPTESESFGLSMLEAMACGVPVVGSRVGGVPEVVVDGETGFLEAVGDVAAMARRVEQLLRDHDLRRRLGDAGARRARERFSLQSSLDGHLRLYHELLDS